MQRCLKIFIATAICAILCVAMGGALMEHSEIRSIVNCVYAALNKKGYRPVDQLIGYILTEDPTYITNYNGARHLITRIDRYDLLQDILQDYFRVEAN